MSHSSLTSQELETEDLKLISQKPSSFPADFIAEGLDQTRGWFYTLTVLSTALFDLPAFKNVVVNGIILAEDGEKMSKSKKNYPDPMQIVDKYGADSLRLYLMSSPAVRAEDLRFSAKGVEEKFRKVILPFWNAYSFFCLYANVDGWHPDQRDSSVKAHLLDLWIISELNILISKINEAMDSYDLSNATKHFDFFLDALNNFYIRRSRRRFWKSDNDHDKVSAYQTLYQVLMKLSLCLSPFCPFVTEKIFTTMSQKKSVHLEPFPSAEEDQINLPLSQEIDLARRIISLGLLARAKSQVKIRFPLSVLQYQISGNKKLNQTQQEIIKDELNIKEVIPFKKSTSFEKILKPDARQIGKKFGPKTKEIFSCGKSGDFKVLDDGRVEVAGEILEKEEFELEFKSNDQNVETFFEEGVLVSLNTTLSKELKQEGIAREFIRQVQDLRKEIDLNVDDRICITVNITDKEIKEALAEHEKYICAETLCLDFSFAKSLGSRSKTIEIEQVKFSFEIEKR